VVIISEHLDNICLINIVFMNGNQKLPIRLQLKAIAQSRMSRVGLSVIIDDDHCWSVGCSFRIWSSFSVDSAAICFHSFSNRFIRTTARWAATSG